MLTDEKQGDDEDDDDDEFFECEDLHHLDVDEDDDEDDDDVGKDHAAVAHIQHPTVLASKRNIDTKNNFVPHDKENPLSKKIHAAVVHVDNELLSRINPAVTLAFFKAMVTLNVMERNTAFSHVAGDFGKQVRHLRQLPAAFSEQPETVL